MKKIIAMIPVRMASTRFPGKPLVDICGKSMIEHVWQRVKLNKNISDIFIATCDEEISTSAKEFGAKVVMTKDTHERCTDRIAEACNTLLEENYDFDAVLTIQGDEPLLNPDSLNMIVEPFLENENTECVNLIEPLMTKEDVESYNNVKVVLDNNKNILYFSRLPIPYGDESKSFKQLGLYGMTKELMLKYPLLDQLPLEKAESVDMLRFLENNISIRSALSTYETIGVDTPEDLEKVISIMKNDQIFHKYTQ